VNRYFADLGAWSFAALRFAELTEFDIAPLGTRKPPLSKLKCAIPNTEHSLHARLSKMLGAMKLIRLTPADEGLEDRIFRCLKYHYIDRWVFKVT
jgi:hypothetical protein